MEEVYKTLLRRINQPFTLSFISASFVTNWKFFYVSLTTFVPVPTEQNRMQFALDQTDINTLFFYPLVFSLFFVVALPLINMVFLWLSQWYLGVEAGITARREQITSSKMLDLAIQTKQTKQQRLAELVKAEQLAKDIYSLTKDWELKSSDYDLRYSKLSKRLKKELYNSLIKLEEAKTVERIGYQNQLPSLIQINETKENIELTDFAKYFVKKYLSES